MNLVEAQAQIDDLKEQQENIEKSAGNIISKLLASRANQGNLSPRNAENDIDKIITVFPNDMKVQILKYAIVALACADSGTKKTKRKRSESDDEFMDSIFASRM